METAPVIRSCFFTECPDFKDFTWSALSDLAEQANLQDIIEGKNVTILAIPSFTHGIEIGNVNVHRPISEETKGDIIARLGLSNLGNELDIQSVRHGGASVIRAILEAAELVKSDQERVIFIVGAENLTSRKTSDIINAAGESVIPQSLYEQTLSPKIIMTLISAYALRESAILLEFVKHDPKYMAYIRLLRKHNNKPFSGEICAPEIAQAKDGALLIIVGTSSNEQQQIYIAAGAVQPEEPLDWLTLPSDYNMALTPMQKIIETLSEAGISIIDNDSILEELQLELYECFFVAQLQQTAAILGIEKITKNNVMRILKFIQNYHPSTTLRQWAAWGISSAKKVFEIMAILQTAESLKEYALALGNGGIMDSIAIIFLVRNLDIAQKLSPFSLKRYDPPVVRYTLESNPEYLAGKEGKIDMIAFQEPVINRQGEIIQPGTTFVRVLLNNICVLTNLLLQDDPDSLYQNLTNKTVIGSRVILKKVNGKPIAAVLVQ